MGDEERGSSTLLIAKRVANNTLRRRQHRTCETSKSSTRALPAMLNMCHKAVSLIPALGTLNKNDVSQSRLTRHVRRFCLSFYTNRHIRKSY